MENCKHERSTSLDAVKLPLCAEKRLCFDCGATFMILTESAKNTEQQVQADNGNTVAG
jgi:hypothetical protein